MFYEDAQELGDVGCIEVDRGAPWNNVGIDDLAIQEDSQQHLFGLSGMNLGLY